MTGATMERNATAGYNWRWHNTTGPIPDKEAQRMTTAKQLANDAGDILVASQKALNEGDTAQFDTLFADYVAKDGEAKAQGGRENAIAAAKAEQQAASDERDPNEAETHPVPLDTPGATGVKVYKAGRRGDASWASLAHALPEAASAADFRCHPAAGNGAPRGRCRTPCRPACGPSRAGGGTKGSGLLTALFPQE